MRHHAMLRACACTLEVPETHQIFRGFNASKAFVDSERIDQAFYLQHGRQVAEQETARSKSIPSPLNYMPRLGKVENDAVDIVFDENLGNIAGFYGPIGRRPEIARDILLREMGKIFTDLIRD